MSKKDEEEMTIEEQLKSLGIQLVNPEKLSRSIFGMTDSNGDNKGGKGEDATVEEVIAEYDRLGGLILKTYRGKPYKVKTGSFYDFKKKQARKEPEVVYVMRDLNGEEIELEEGKEVPLEVEAAEKRSEKKKASKKKASKVDDEEETVDEDEE